MAINKEKLHQLIDQITDPMELETVYQTIRTAVEHADQSWYWTERWQAGEREANEDIVAGQVYGPFNSSEELMQHLDLLAGVKNDEN